MAKSLFILSFFLINCSNMANQHSTEKITVIGKAMDMKAGAVILTADRQAYFIDGLSHWSPQFAGEQLEVKGDLVEINKIPKSTVDSSGARSQGSTTRTEGDIQRVIKNATWRMVE